MAVTILELEKTIAEAQRFIKSARAAKERLKNDELAGISGSKETAAARRSSLDLTRQLAKLRKPPQ